MRAFSALGLCLPACLLMIAAARGALGQDNAPNNPPPAPRRRALQTDPNATPAPVRETPSPTQTLETPSPTQTPETPAPTEVPDTPGPTEVPETPAPTEVPETPGPTMNPTLSPTLAPSPAPTTPGPTPSPTLSPTPSPTFSKSPTLAPTPAPTPPPTFSFDSYCERPYALANESDIPCVEMVTAQDVISGVGAFYDEEGCQWQQRGGSVVGCSLRGIDNCRLCVFNRALYSVAILDGEPVPFVDCPCCVPELFEMGGDIDCDFKVSAAPIPTPVDEPAPTAAPVTKSPTIAPDDSGGNNGNNGNNGDRNIPVDLETPAPPAMATTSPPTVPPIPTEPCERGAGGATGANTTLCVDLTSPLDRQNGIGVYYEQGCQGRGCDILDKTDCRQCLFDRVAFSASGQEGEEEIVDCPCCVPITYKLFPDDTQCVWPATPVPTGTPTTLAQLLASDATRGRRGRGSPPDSVMGLVAQTMAAVGAVGCVLGLAF